MTAIAKMRIFARAFATDSRLVFRKATLRDADIITRRAVQEGWHIGPYDYRNILTFDPKSYIFGEVEGEIAAHVGLIEFPKNHYHGGGVIVTDKYREKGIASQCILQALSTSNKEYTIGTDITLDSLAKYESFGFKKYWKTYVALLSLEKIAKTITKTELQNFFVQSLHEVDLPKLLQYDEGVFGAPRHALMERWINTPGSFGWAAVDKSTTKITGYTVLKQAIRGGGTEIGLAVAPLYADKAEIAKFLIEKAVKECLTNPAIPKTKLEIVLPIGDDCGEGVEELMKELDAELIPICYRVYTKGIPPGRQTKKIYGIVSPSCD